MTTYINARSYLPVWQFVPVYPATHVQL